MPLSNDFDKSRLEYLKMQIKNNDVVKEQFYPRFQRAYNEMFPYTEGNVQNVLQPQQQVITESAPIPTEEGIKLSLIQKINELTKNEAMAEYIFSNLNPEEQYYYDSNFDKITKELLKKIKLPTSKEEFLMNLTMLFHNDSHKNNLMGLSSRFTPLPQAQALPPPPGTYTIADYPINVQNAISGYSSEMQNEIETFLKMPPVPSNNQEQQNEDSIKASIAELALQNGLTADDLANILNHPGKMSPVTQADDLEAQRLFRKARLPPRPIRAQKGSISTDLLGAIQTLRATSPNDSEEFENAEELVGFEAVRLGFSSRELAKALRIPGTRGRYSNRDIAYAEKLLLTGKNTTKPTDRGFLKIKKKELNQYVKNDLQILKRNNQPVDATITNNLIAQYKNEIVNNDVRKEVERREKSSGRPLSQQEKDDARADVEQKFFGFGLKQSRIIKHKQDLNSKYAIDIKQLKKNVLALKYLKNANNHATFKPIDISDHFKSIIEHNILKGQKVSKADFETLSITEKRVLKRLYQFLKMDLGIDDHKDNFQKEFEVAYGSFLAGNDNKQLKKELKEYIKIARHEAIISKEEANKMLQKLSS